MTSRDPLPESAVLAQRDPSITNSDDWPEFQLQDAFVTLPDTDDCEPASLLIASEYYPVTITGRLLPPSKGQEDLWLRKDAGKKGTSIVVADARSFAYGAYDDGSVELWAAGKAGWFVIHPGRAYKKTFQNMCEAVKMLFLVADMHKEPATKKRRKHVQAWSEPSTEQVFGQYARESLGDGARSIEAAEAIYKHRDFLLSSMLAGKEGVAWSRTSIFRHLSRRFPDDLKEIRERSAQPESQKEKPESTRMARARQSSVDSVSTTSSLKRKRGRPPKNRPVDVISIGSSSASSSAKKDLPQRPTRERSETQKSKQTTRSEPVPRPTRRTRISSQSIPRSPTPEIQESATPAQDSDSEDEPRRNASKGKSALRLKPSKPMKGPPKKPRRSSKAPAEDDEEPRSSPMPSKRKRDDQAAETRRAKRAASKDELDEGIDIPTSPSAHSTPPDDPDAEAGAPPPLADSFAGHKPDPLQENTWLCALDGCTHKIYGDPSDPTSQRLIREHYALHAYDDDARVQLVKRLQAPSLPVSHLMERVKVAAKGEGFPGSNVAGTRFPEPLRTWY